MRLDSGDLLSLSREARRLLDDAGMEDSLIVASGDLHEHTIAELVRAKAPIDLWGVGTELGTSRDSPVVNGVYKLVADMRPDGSWRGVRKRSPEKATVPGSKQVFRIAKNGRMRGDVIAAADEVLPGRPLLVPVMRNGTVVHHEPLDAMRTRAASELRMLPEALRLPRAGEEPPAYTVIYSERLQRIAGLGEGSLRRRSRARSAIRTLPQRRTVPSPDGWPSR